MIQIILLDVDGVIIKLREKYFSQKLIDDFQLSLNTAAITGFFRHEFPLCETGKLDLREELEKQIKAWGYPGTAEGLMKYWFEGEAELMPNVVNLVKTLRNRGVKFYLATNNEKYRTDYLLRVVGIKDFTDGCFSSATIGYLKSQPEFWPEVYQRLGNPPKDSILVWDNTLAIVETAKQFGFLAEQYTDFDSFRTRLAEYLPNELAN